MPLFRKTGNGKLLKIPTGAMAHECCCADDGADVWELCNPCFPDPEMLVSVSNLGATETINWVGQTWNLPADNGIEKSVCPTSYTLHNNFVSGSYTFWAELWQYNVNSLRLFRNYRIGGFPSHRWTDLLEVVSDKDEQIGYPDFTITNTPNSTLNLIIGEGPVTSGDYRLKPAWFNTYTKSSVTYTWAKGLGW